MKRATAENTDIRPRGLNATNIPKLKRATSFANHFVRRRYTANESNNGLKEDERKQKEAEHMFVVHIGVLRTLRSAYA